MKNTKRKGFNFLRSYFDVLNEIPQDKDKLQFLIAIINKQFLNEDPKGLSFISNLCYESQRHQIESSVKGWERASNEELSDTPPTPLGTTPPTPKQEEELEEEEKGKEKEKLFTEFWSLYGKSLDKKKCEKKFISLPQKDIDKILVVVQHYVNSTPEKKFRKNPLTWLNGECWNDEIEVVKKPKANLAHLFRA